MDNLQKITTIEILGHSRVVKIHHEIKLRCPICQRVFSMNCITGVPNQYQELEDIVQGLRTELYYKHILDCKGY